MRIKINIYLLIILSIVLSHCKADKDLKDLSGSGYPKEVGNILLTNCAVSGCHNDQSKEAAGGLSLTTWNNMFKGARGEAVTIPFQHKFSPLFLFTNTYNNLGLGLKPTMPIGKPPLSEEEIKTLRDWIDQGAPDAEGNIKFSNSLKKIYVTNQGCDVVAVLDQKTGLVMRYINVGNLATTESPHSVRVSPDGKSWYVVFIQSNIIQKYSTRDDSFQGQAVIGTGSWNTFVITPDSKYAFITDFNNDQIAYVDLTAMQLKFKYSNYSKPHGIAITNSGNTLYVCAQQSNFIYKINVTDPSSDEFITILLQGGFAPHEVVLSPDETKYFVTCQGSNDLRIFSVATDELLAIIPTGSFPQEVVLSKNGYGFVTCPEDTSSFAGKRGSVTVFNHNNNSFVKNIFVGFQPHGIAVDEEKGLVYIANRNISESGPAPHHTTECGGRNGYLTHIDLYKLELIEGSQTELSVDPYFISIKN